MAKRTAISWDNIVSELARARETNDVGLKDKICRFLSLELEQCHVRMLGAGSKVFTASLLKESRRKGVSHYESKHLDMEEARQRLLMKVMEKGLSVEIQDVRSYLYTSLQRQYIDVQRKESRLRHKDSSYGHDRQYVMREEAKSSYLLNAKWEAEELKGVLLKLNLRYRVYLKLAYCKEWLTEEEFFFLSQQSRLGLARVRQLTESAKTYADFCTLTDGLVAAPEDKKMRAVLGDRFRKRLDSAVDALVALMHMNRLQTKD